MAWPRPVVSRPRTLAVDKLLRFLYKAAMHPDLEARNDPRYAKP